MMCSVTQRDTKTTEELTNNEEFRYRISVRCGEALKIGVGICPRALERQSIIVSICNVCLQCAFEPRGGL